MRSTCLKAAFLWLFCCTVLLLAGCASPKAVFQTRKDPSYHDKFGKVLIVTEYDDLAAQVGTNFLSRLLVRLTGSLAQRNVASEIVHMNKRDADPNAAIKSAADQFRPGQLLYIAVSHVKTRTRMGSPVSAPVPDRKTVVSVTVSFSMEDRQSGKTVWRGDAQYDAPPRPENVGDALLKQLEAEGLF